MASSIAQTIDHGRYISTEVTRAEGDLFISDGDTLIKNFLPGSLPPEHIVVGRGSTLEMNILIFPGTDSDVPITVDIVGEDSSVQLNCLFLGNAEDRIKFRVNMHHRTSRSISRQVFIGLLAGSSNALFDGRIIVAPDAQKIEAYQECHGILLSPHAKIDTRPQLEIYADDVKCSHGATVGMLNEEEQFYMRSRGIPESEAKALQMVSFASAIIRRLPDSADVIEQAIRSLI